MGTLQVGGTTLGVKNTSTNKVDLSNVGDIASGTLGNNVAVQSSFAVTDISSSFEVGLGSSGGGANGWDGFYCKAYAFNGFVFINLECRHVSAHPSTQEQLAVNTNANYHPSVLITCPSAGWGGDTADKVRFETDGTITVSHDSSTSQNPGSLDYHVRINAFYRYV
tara:strand:- start:83 stop:580 length:498 start_codon:yes stop_codon:yes gene_type:complete